MPFTPKISEILSYGNYSRSLIEEMILDPGSLGLGDIAAIDENDAHVDQDATQIPPDGLLVVGPRRNGFVDQDKLLGGSQTRQGCTRQCPPATGP